MKRKLLLAAVTLFAAVFMGGSSLKAQVWFETDLTKKFESLATSQWEGSSGQVGWAAPQVETNSGLTVAAWESYRGDWNGGCTNTGTVMKTTVSGLPAGTYKIELYGAAAFTYDRNFGSEAFTGDLTVANSDKYSPGDNISENTGVSLYAKTSKGEFSQEIPIWYADNFNGSGLSTATLYGVEVGEDGVIEIGMIKTSKSTNWHVVQLKGVTATVDAVALYEASLSKAQGLETAKMSSDRLTALTTALSTYGNLGTSATADQYQAAIDALDAAAEQAEASAASYAKLKAAIDANAALAGTLTQDAQNMYATAVADVIATYDNAIVTYVDGHISTLNDALYQACKSQAQPADGSYMTAWIENPSFEDGLNGWDNQDMQIQNNTSFEKVGTLYAESWQPAGTKRLSQAITQLPKGHYCLSAKIKARDVLSASLFAGENKTAITIQNETNTYNVEFLCLGDVTIGFEGEGSSIPVSDSWLCVDDFQLTYLRQLTGEEEAAIAKVEYDFARDAAQNVEQGSIPAKNYTTLQGLIQNTLPEGSSAAQYEAATETLNKAVAAAAALKAPYATWNELVANAKAVAPQDQHPAVYNAIVFVENYVEDNLIDAATLEQFNVLGVTLLKNYSEWIKLLSSAVSLKAVDNNNPSANETLTGAIDKQHGEISNASVESLEDARRLTVFTIPDAIQALKEAMVTYVGVAEPTKGECFDLTFMIVNPHFTEGDTYNATGWTLESGAITEHRVETHNFETWHKKFNLSQTIPNLPKGTYKVTLQGFARHDGSEIDKTRLYCGPMTQVIKNIKDEYSETPFFYSPMEGTYCPLNGNMERNYDTAYELGGTTVYQPNGMTGSCYYFQATNPVTEQPFYINEVKTVLDAPGDLKIGFKCETDLDWVIWDNFHLYFYSSAIEVEMDEDVPQTFDKDLENANVTLKRTIKEGLNSVVLPFDMSQAEVEKYFGEGSVVYVVDAFDDETSTVLFEEVDGIQANVPCILKATKAGTSYEINGRHIYAAEPVVSDGKLRFIGSYGNVTIPSNEGNYILYNGELLAVDSDNPEDVVTMKGYRAYFKVVDDSAAGSRVLSMNFDGGEADDIVEVDSEKVADGIIYNLAGQPVGPDYKGVAIINGKTVLLK